MSMRVSKFVVALPLLLFLVLGQDVMAQATGQDAISGASAGLALREIGPAVAGGRIADIEVGFHGWEDISIDDGATGTRHRVNRKQ